MSIHYAGSVIAEARKRAGLTQEQLAEGICDPSSLSCIERGISGVSPATFRALMEHAGVAMESFPVFVDRNDFECFYTLKRARFYLDGWFLTEAGTELYKVYNLKCAGNKFHYQEWLLLQCRLLLRSGSHQRDTVYHLADEALRLSKPNYKISDFTSCYLSVNEVELLLCLAEIGITSSKLSDSLAICTQLSDYLQKSSLTLSVKNHLLGENAVTWCRGLLATESYPELLKLAEHYRHLAVIEDDDSLLFELTFFTGLGHYYQGDKETALRFVKTAFYSAHSIGNCYATYCRSYILQHTDLHLSKMLLSLPDIPLVSYPCKKITDTAFHNGIYDLSSFTFYQFGDLVHDLRTEQHITQTVLCQGLCTKSALSKIENNALMPDAALAETLLQRLGISDKVFSFFSNKEIARLHELKNRLIHCNRSDISAIESYLAEGEKILQSVSSPVYRQYFLFKKTIYQRQTSQHISALEEALAITLPDFQINHILEYRLSWNELTILNNLANAYAQNGDDLKAIRYTYMILDYLKENGNDILHWKRIYCVTISFLSGYLYKIKQYNELVSFLPQYLSPGLLHAIYFAGATYGNYCQALGECHLMEQALLYATYAYYAFLITGQINNATTISRYMDEDFHIIID